MEAERQGNVSPAFYSEDRTETDNLYTVRPYRTEQYSFFPDFATLGRSWKECLLFESNRSRDVTRDRHTPRSGRTACNNGREKMREQLLGR